MANVLRLGGALVGCFALVGCSLSAAPPPVPLEGDRTWSGVVGPLVVQRCGGCHREGDIGPFPLETYDEVVAMKSAVLAAVQQRRMPPFPPTQTDASGCPQIEDVRRMTEDERTLLIDWLLADLPRGGPGEPAKAKPFEPLGPPNDVFKMTEPYVSGATTEDDYRCFLIDPVLLTDYPVAAISVLPGTRSVVHHSAVFLVPPNGLDAVKKLDAADPGPGYSCFGGVGTTAIPAAVWVPGNDAPLVPTHTGLGYYLLPGWTLVLQNHYNFASGKQADQSSVVVWRTQAGFVTEIPRALLVGTTDFTIPPGAVGYQVEANSHFNKPATPSEDVYSAVEGRVYAVWAHQHKKGRTFELDLVRADGTEQCLLHIPKWDFNWQSIYRLKSTVAAKAGDSLRVRCSWDNAGPDAMPVTYGEGTSDEMCFGSVALIGL